MWLVEGVAGPMVNGITLNVLSESAILHGSNNSLHLRAHSSLPVSCRGLEIRRRYQSIPCGLRNGEKLKVSLSKKASGRLVDISETSCMETFDSGSMSSQSVASPASAMDMTEEHEFEIDSDDDDDELGRYRALILDVAYRPINVVNWKRALCLDILEKADVLEYYDQVVYSPSRMFFIPAVLKVHSFLHSPRRNELRLTLNRRNIFLRDKFQCQYCSADSNLTIDHVYAASRGGGWTWDNLVTACSSCNMKKASKTLEEAHMILVKAPKEPKFLESGHVPPNYKTFRSLRNHKRTPPEWLGYLPRGLPQLQ